jgi:hypothetical protein
MQKINKEMVLLNGENLSLDTETKQLTGITKRNPQEKTKALALYAAKKGLIKPEEESSLVGALDSLLTGLETTAKLKGETQFAFPQRIGIQLSKNQKYPAVKIDFSRQRIDGLFNQSLSILRESVFELFGQVEDFSDKLTKYFSSTSPNRGSTFGKSAVEAANNVKEKTVKTVTSEK